MTIHLSTAVALVTIIFLLGIIIGTYAPEHVSGRLIIDESGDTERWSFIMDDPIDKVKGQRYICLRIEKHE